MSPGLKQGAMDQRANAEIPKDLVFQKMENLIREMQHPETGIPVRCQKVFLTSVPCAFLGIDLIEWLTERLQIDDQAEALQLANLLCQHGYFFPVHENKLLVHKDENAIYRFQNPVFWPYNHHPDNTEYAIYLVKRGLKSKHALEEYEQEALARLKKQLSQNWEFIKMEAEEQVNRLKERKKADRTIVESQEKAYWHLHRPPPGSIYYLEKSPMEMRRSKKNKKAMDDLKLEIEIKKRCLARTRCKVSQAVECLLHRCKEYGEFDPYTCEVLPSNPWISDDITLWTLNESLVEIATEKRIKRWAISLQDLLQDPTGTQEFEQYLKKEYSHENVHFWLAVNELKRTSQKIVQRRVAETYNEFLVPGAPQEVNLDSKTLEIINETMKKPTRYTFDAAQKHVFTLMKNDTYPRFLRSEHYRNLLINALQPSQKKRFCNFGYSTKKKTSPSSSHKHKAHLSGSTQDLSPTAKEKSVRWPFSGRHSHSTSDLQDLGAPSNKIISSTHSSPSGSRECMNESARATLQVPRWNHRKSDSAVLLEESNFGLSLAVPARNKNVVTPWDSEI